MSDTHTGVRATARRAWSASGPLLTLATIALIELLSRTVFRVPTPGAALLVPVAYSAFRGGRLAGLASATLMLGYLLYVRSNPGQLFRYSRESVEALLVLAIVAPAMVLMISAMRSRSERAAAELFESEAKYRMLFTHHPLPMWVYDLKTLAFLEVNAAAVANYGYSRERFLSMRISDIRPPEDVPRLLESVAAPRPELQHSGAWRHLYADGRIRHVRIASHLLTYEGRRAALVVADDITELKQAEAAIRQLNSELERRVLDRTMQLEVANNELEAFSYSVSHDLRAPLRSIDGFSQALLEDYADRLDDLGKDYLGRVRAASQRMARLIDDLLRLSQVTRSELHREQVDMSALAREIFAGLGQAQPERQAKFEVEGEVAAWGDRALLRVALENLLGNAWKFTARSARACIAFGSTAGEEVPIYYVRDNGAGFDMAYAGKLFGAFQRLHTLSEFEGTGIGLAIVQRVIHRHGGRIWAEGSVGEGATFYFTLEPRNAPVGGYHDPASRG
jgi:PAS domain S-box-containing protein